MTAAEIIAALDLPAAARVERRVPKTLLLEHGAPTAADRRKINEGIEQLQWVAALKPATVGVAEYRDAEREYLEIAVVRLAFRANAKALRLTTLVHRAVPYPVVLLAEQGEGATLSLAHKRWSQGEEGKVVLDGEVQTVVWSEADEAHRGALLATLALGQQPRNHLFDLYQGWIDTFLAMLAARRTGCFGIPKSAKARRARREALMECEHLETEMARLRAAAVKEKQVPRQVELNLELKRLQQACDAALAQLGPGAKVR